MEGSPPDLRREPGSLCERRSHRFAPSGTLGQSQEVIRFNTIGFRLEVFPTVRPDSHHYVRCGPAPISPERPRPILDAGDCGIQLERPGTAVRPSGLASDHIDTAIRVGAVRYTARHFMALSHWIIFLAPLSEPLFRLIMDGAHVVASAAGSFEDRIPMPPMRHRNGRWKPAKESAVVTSRPAAPVGAEVCIVHHQHVGLVRTVDDEGVATV